MPIGVGSTEGKMPVPPKISQRAQTQHEKYNATKQADLTTTIETDNQHRNSKMDQATPKNTQEILTIKNILDPESITEMNLVISNYIHQI